MATLCLLCLQAACINLPETWRDRHERRRVSDVETARRDCNSYGLSEPSDAFAACMQRELAARRGSSAPADARPGAVSEPLN